LIFLFGLQSSQNYFNANGTLKSDCEMSGKFQVSVLLLLFSLLTIPNLAIIRIWTPGVAAGDCFYFKMYGVYTSNQPNITLAIPQFEYNNTEWARINVTSVEGSMIYQVYTLHFLNGSESNFNFKTNVNPANERYLQFNERGVPICATNLCVGDFIPTAETTINETVIRNYASGPRETNHALWNNSDDWGNCYFDRETGILVDLHRTHRFASNITDNVVWKTDVIEMIDSNRWEINAKPSAFSILFIVLIAVFFALLSLFIATYRLVTRRTHRRLQIDGRANYK
jgi:hypothetical protein